MNLSLLELLGSRIEGELYVNKTFKELYATDASVYRKLPVGVAIPKSRKDIQQIINFANLTNFVALKGGAIKKEQMLSGHMADIFSNLYLALSVKYYHSHYKTSVILRDYIIENLVNENQNIINTVISNLGVEKYLLLHLTGKVENISYNRERKVFNEILTNTKILDEIKKNIYLDNNVLGDLENINQYDKNSDKYNKLKEIIINVDEFKN